MNQGLGLRVKEVISPPGVRVRQHRIRERRYCSACPVVAIFDEGWVLGPVVGVQGLWHRVSFIFFLLIDDEI